MKRFLPLLLALSVAASGFVGSRPASAAQVSIGLDSRKNVFVQEIWQSGAPRYLISNGNDEPVIVAAYPFSPEAEKTPSIGLDRRALLGPWQVEAHAVVNVDASGLEGQGLAQWELGDGTVLGLLNRPQRVNNIIRIYSGINGSSGTDSGIYTEQNRLRWQPGDIIELRLMAPAGITEFSFPKTIAPNQDSKVTGLPIKEAVSNSLTVTSDEKQISFSTTKPLKQLPLHTVTLRFTAPKTEVATLYSIEGQVKLNDGTSFVLSRGIVVAPADQPEQMPVLMRLASPGTIPDPALGGPPPRGIWVPVTPGIQPEFPVAPRLPEGVRLPEGASLPEAPPLPKTAIPQNTRPPETIGPAVAPTEGTAH